ncbi:hypothetical protein WJX84_011072 [Apatococcus fuscideae]|uniref:Uncharacterized protein n=1 Tax=Apatococcus fuscideae TaxID=2026836 RepID=A0AAW1T2G1_9CHLO
MLWLLVAVQAVALVGATVTGSLARRRRLKLEQLNVKLRQVNAQLMKRRAQEEGVEQEAEIAEAELQARALATARASLSLSLEAPAAAHPFESYGDGSLSLAQARRKLSGLLQASKSSLRDNAPSQALQRLAEADTIAEELQDKRARRALLRVRAQALQQVGQLQAALSTLQESLDLSAAIGDSRDEADMYGAVADLLADMGRLEEAAKYYDRCCQAIQET